MRRSKAPLTRFGSMAGDRVRVHPEHAPFAYSDGKEVEVRIHAALRGTTDLSVGSPELMAKATDWPTEYHFSDTRVNLLRHLPLRPGLKVLELGAGCGAITRFLGESGCEVTAVEGSLMRARCASERVRDLQTVSVYCADFQDIAFDHEFDVVTLIGVLEYAPMFFEGEDPIGDCLAVARAALKPAGTLVVAIENQLGLKYFAGATEDHLGTHYSGIEDRYLPKGVRTMGRHELEHTLHAAGFGDVAFQYPFPDYKLPVALLFEQGLAGPDFRPSEIVRHLHGRDYSGRHRRSIDTSQVWPVLERNGMLREMSNSFLVLAGQRAAEQHVLRSRDEDLLAVSYSPDRARRYQTRTAFRVDVEGSITVEKSLLYPHEAQAQVESGGMQHRLTRDRYYNGVTLHSEITAALRRRDRGQVVTLLRKWLDFLRQVSGAGEAMSWVQKLPGELWDCTPGNLIVLGDELRYIDAEWVSEPGPEAGHLLLRYVFSLAYRESSAMSFAECFKGPIRVSIRRLVEEMGLSLTDDLLRSLSDEINQKNAVIFPLHARIALERRDFIESAGRAWAFRVKSVARDMFLKVASGLSGAAAR